MNICPKCGAKIEGIFCPECGYRLEKTIEPQNNAVPPKMESSGSQTGPYHKSGRNSAKANKNKKMAILAVVAGVLLLGIGAVLIWGNMSNRHSDEIAMRVDDHELENNVYQTKNDYSEHTPIKGDEQEATYSDEATTNTILGENSNDLDVENRAESIENEVSQEDDIQRDLFNEFNINTDTPENYSNNLDPNRYRFYDSGISDFSFRFPPELFNYVNKETDAFEDKYGTNIEMIQFSGTEGTEVVFSLSRRHDGMNIEQATGNVHTHETNSLIDPSDILVSTKEDYGKVIITGWTSDGRSVYDLTKIENDYVLNMSIILAEYTSDDDKNIKGYIVENMYRFCGFSDSKYSPRSYSEYLEANK